MRRKQKWYENKAVWAWFIMIVMVASTLGFALINANTSGSNTKIEYNGFTFYATQGRYFTTVNNVKYYFRYLPSELEDISYENIDINTDKIYLVYDPKNDLNNDYAVQNIGGFLQYRNLIVQPACIQEDGCSDIPIIKCTDNKKMILFFEGNNTSIYNKDNCIVFEFSNIQEMDKLHEKFIYVVLGIIN